MRRLFRGCLLRSRVCWCLLLLSLAVFIGCNCGTPAGEVTETPQPVTTDSQANTPQLIANVTPAPVQENGVTDDPFEVTIHHAILFDPRTGPLNAERSDEAGVHLLLAGTIRNQSGRLIHRAAIYSTLIASFGDRTELERHSGGLGFSPRVNSLDPWRPETERAFFCITRPLDPIYLELVPHKLQAAITVQARDPLDFRFRKEIAKVEVKWDAILGKTIDQWATITVSGPCRCASQLRKTKIANGSKVHVLYQRGSAYKVLTEDQRLVWVGYDRLLFLTDEEVEKSTKINTKFPFKMLLKEDILLNVLSVAEYDSEEEANESNKIYRVELEFINKGEKAWRTPSLRAFALDIGAGAYKTTINGKIKHKDSYRQVVLRPGETTRGALFFSHENGSFPFDLELYLNEKPPFRVPLFPALLASQTNGHPN